MYEKAYALLVGCTVDACTPDDVQGLIRSGIEMVTFEKIVEIMQVSDAFLLPMIGANPGSFQHGQAGGRLDPQQSAHTLAIVNLLAEASDYFGDRDKALRWLKTPKLALGNKAPLDYCATQTGIALVENAIKKLKYAMTA